MKRAICSLMGLLLLAGCTTASAKAAAPAASKQASVRVLELPRPKGGEWFGLYVLGKKAGYAFFDLHEGTWEGQPAIVEESRVTLKASVGGVETTREVDEQRFYERKNGGRLLAFREERHGDGGDETLIGSCSPKACELLRQRPGLPDEKRSLAPTGEQVEHSDAPRLVAESRQRIEGVTIDLEQTLEDKKMVTEFDGEGSYTVAGVSVPVARTRTTEERSQMPVITTIAKDGRVLELRFGEVMIGKAEEEKLAKQLDKVDLFSLTRVVLAKPIPEVVRVGPAEVVYEIRGLSKELRRESYRQKFEEQAGGLVRLAITARAPKASAKLPVAAGNDKDLQDALKSTLAVESTAKPIVELARKVVGDEKDAWTAAKRLNLTVYSMLEKSYGTSSDRATDVLAARRGDCTEHALLFTALARAAGIPARRVDGLVYMQAGDGVPALYWHEWAEVWVGEWVAIDPTFNQPIADPTHIAFGNEGQSDTAGLIGQLKIQVVEAKPLAAPAGEAPAKAAPR
jgi:transglutaminase-like putative cysteine protease